MRRLAGRRRGGGCCSSSVACARTLAVSAPTQSRPCLALHETGHAEIKASLTMRGCVPRASSWGVGVCRAAGKPGAKGCWRGPT